MLNPTQQKTNLLMQVQVHFFKLDTLVLCKMSLWSQQDSLFGGQVGG